MTAWAVSFLTASAVTLATRVSTLSRASELLRDRARARRAAESAAARLARALVEHPELPPDRLTAAAWRTTDEPTPAPEEGYRFDDGTGLPLRLAGDVADEERRLNINTAPPEALSRLLQRVTAHDPQEADAIASAILDWRDADDYVRLDGAESSYYGDLPKPYRPANGPFELFEELSLVRGVTPEDLEQLRPYVTVYGPGQVNVMTAAAPVLQALGMSEELTNQILRFRAGEDGAAGTADDPAYPTVGAFIAAFKESVMLPVQDDAQLGHLAAAGALATTGSVWRVRIRVAAGGRRAAQGRLTECVIDRSGRVIAWHES